MVTLCALRAEIGALGKRRWVQGPAARIMSVAGRVCDSEVVVSVYVTEDAVLLGVDREVTAALVRILAPASEARAAMEVVNW